MIVLRKIALIQKNEQYWQKNFQDLCNDIKKKGRNKHLQMEDEKIFFSLWFSVK